MHQIIFGWGFAPRPHWGAYSDPADPLAGLGVGPPGKGKAGREGERRRGEGREGSPGMPKSRVGKPNTACRCEQCLQQQQLLQCAVRVTCLVLRLYNLSFNEAPDSLQAVYLQAWRYHDHRHPPRVLSRRLDNRRPSTKWTTT